MITEAFQAFLPEGMTSILIELEPQTCSERDDYHYHQQNVALRRTFDNTSKDTNRVLIPTVLVSRGMGRGSWLIWMSCMI
jgi:hypothetical protein